MWVWTGMKKVFYAKRSPFYVVGYITIISIIVLVLVCSEAFIVGAMRHIIPAILGLVAVLVSVFYFRLYYEISENYLTIVFGFLKIEIIKSDIVKIEEVKKITKSFALSSKCLCLYYGKSTTRKFNKFYVSPKNENEFIIELKGVSKI